MSEARLMCPFCKHTYAAVQGASCIVCQENGHGWAVTSVYGAEDRVVVRRAAYREIAVHSDGPGVSVYLNRWKALRLAGRLVREVLRK